MFKAKLRNIGTSFGVIIPMNTITQNKLKEGEEIELLILNKNKKIIDESFGIDKGNITFKFVRDKSDRLDKHK